MKNILITLSFLLFAGISFSQVKVFTDGKTYIGDNTGVATPDEQLQVDGLWKADAGTIEATGASGTILFERTGFSAVLMGAGGHAGFTLDENYNFEIRSRVRSEVLDRKLSGGQFIIQGRGSDGHLAFGYGTPSATDRARFNGTINVNGTTLPSDKKLKKNVNEFSRGLNELMEINPITYNYNGKGGIADTDMVHVGLFAQDLQKVAPELVSSEDFYSVDIEDEDKKTFEDNYLKINDTGIKYMIINAVKEQQEIIEEQEDRIAALEELVKTLIEGNNTHATTLEGGDGKTALLGNNFPNPFTVETKIEYFIPETANSGAINFYDMTGKLIKSVDIDEKGNGLLNVSLDNMASGMYNYQLVVDGNVIGSKKMTITK